MATVREIKRRMRSIKNISQITKAVQMVAALKMRKAQDQALRGQPYSEKMQQMLKHLASRIDPSFHPLLKRKIDETKKTCVLFLTPNKGLCGGLLTDLAKVILDLTEKKTEIGFLLVGKKGREILANLGQEVLADFPDLPDQPLFAETIPISKMIIEGFTKEEFGKVLAVYPHFVNTLVQQALVKQILPIEEELETGVVSGYILFEPNPEVILNQLLPFYIEFLIYHLILESIASEHSARMRAMKNATDNALEILSDLTFTYNQARQAAITREMAEITSARMAMKGQR